MSRTDKTAPWAIQMRDAIGNTSREPLVELADHIEAHCPSSRYWYITRTFGGASGRKGHAKDDRKVINGQRRRRERDFCRDAVKTHPDDLSDLDIRPVVEDRRCVSS